MSGPLAALLPPGDRLHLQYGPIDLIIGVDPERDGGRQRAFSAAADRFDGLLEELVAELPLLRRDLRPDAERPSGSVAQRMHAATLPFCGETFLTRMAAVAGAVADEVLAAMVAAEPLRRAYVNNGGDIALHLTGNARFTTAMATETGQDLGRIALAAGDGIGGIATSGTGGRSHSLGIADSVTVLAASAAAADAAATLIANAVDLPGHPDIGRVPASEIQPDSDLGDRPVVTHVGVLTPQEISGALASGIELAAAMLRQNRLVGAALFLRGEQRLTGAGFGASVAMEKVEHVRA
jgi:uncharacterized protein